MTRAGLRILGRAAPVCAAAMLAACATADNGTAMMNQQAEAQVELAKLRDKTARAEYNDQAVYLGLIRKMQQEGLYFASLAHIEVYRQRFGNGSEMLSMRADALRETGQDAAAVDAYRQLASTAQGAQAAHARHGLGLVAARQGDFARAVLELREAAALDPVNPQIAGDLGFALMRVGALQEARVPVMQSLELDARNPRAISNAAVWLMADGKRSQATAIMQRAALPEATRSAIRKEADRVARAAAARDRNPQRPAPTRAPVANASATTTTTTVVSIARPITVATQEGAIP